ncbi:DUF2336 domain-containing protein [Parvibaculum sp.]|uniref:DUF2336 domain-containing protein n=1 Tax=Parvibaculum sp. TaxID=2024848 RepID=UPI000C96DFEF|nr:DUF2336 domain-containing protein [Parvibaculum sp.]MAB14966.1 hypothetical protein [Parvibaculum sp.]
MALGITQNRTVDAPADTGRDGETVLRRIADLALLPSNLVPPQERSLLDGVLAQLVSRLDEGMRLRLAERLGQQSDCPRELAMALARDDVKIAEQILLEGMPLADGDLVRIVSESDEPHRFIIAGRRGLSSAVADEIIEHGETATICRLLNNRSVRLSLRAIEILVARSASDPEFREPLLARSELSARLAQLMFWWCEGGQRLEIMQRFTVDRSRIHDLLDPILGDGEGLRGMDDAMRVALSLLGRPREIDREKLMSLVAGVGKGELHRFSEDLAAISAVRPETMYRILNDHGGEPLAVFAKAMSLSRKEFGELIVVTVDARQEGLPTKQDLDRIGGLFDSLTADKADVALRYWDVAMGTEAGRAEGEGA